MADKFIVSFSEYLHSCILWLEQIQKKTELENLF